MHVNMPLLIKVFPKVQSAQQGATWFGRSQCDKQTKINKKQNKTKLPSFI
jgi:hypothetical protein